MASKDPLTHETNPQTYLRQMRDTYSKLSPDAQRLFAERHAAENWPKISEAAIAKYGLPPVGTLPKMSSFLDDLFAMENQFGDDEIDERFTHSAVYKSLRAQQRELGLTEEEWHEAIKTATGGRTSSSSDCTEADADSIRQTLNDIDLGRLVKDPLTLVFRRPLAVDFDWKSWAKANSTTLKATLERSREIAIELGIGPVSKLSQIDDRVFTRMVDVVANHAGEANGPDIVVTIEDSPASDPDVKPLAHGGEGESRPVQISYISVHLNDGRTFDASITELLNLAAASLAGAQ